MLGRSRLFTDEHGRATAGHRPTRNPSRAVGGARAVGYRGVAIPARRSTTAAEPSTPEGRIDGRDNDYVVGWIKREPSGVIGTNKSDSQDTVNTLAADLRGKQPREAGPGYAEEQPPGCCSASRRLVTEGHWQLIDAMNAGAGEPHGRPGQARRRRRHAAHRSRVVA